MLLSVLPYWPLVQKRSVLGSTEYPNFSENLQYWRYFDPCRPYPYRPYCVYDYFSIERLCYFIEIQMGPKEILGCSFMPQRSEIGQEMAKLQLFSYWEVGWFYWEPHETKGDPWVFICATKIGNRSRNGWVMAILPLRGCVISLRTTWVQKGYLGVHLCQKDPKSVKKWLS